MRRHGPQATTGFQQGDANVPSEAYSPGDPGLWPARVFSQRRQQIQQREQRNLNGEQSLFPPRLLFTRPRTLYRSDAFTGASLACLPGMEPFKGLEGLAGSDLTAETSDSIQKPPSQVQLPPPRGAFSILVSSRQAIEEFSAQSGSPRGSCGFNSAGPRAGSSDVQEHGTAAVGRETLGPGQPGGRQGAPGVTWHLIPHSPALPGAPRINASAFRPPGVLGPHCPKG